MSDNCLGFCLCPTCGGPAHWSPALQLHGCADPDCATVFAEHSARVERDGRYEFIFRRLLTPTITGRYPSRPPLQNLPMPDDTARRLLDRFRAEFPALQAFHRSLRRNRADVTFSCPSCADTTFTLTPTEAAQVAPDAICRHCQIPLTRSDRPDRQGCTCTCCDHSEGSDCACDCHATGRCAFHEAKVPPPETE